MEALTYDEMRPGCYERDARIKDFELNWVDGSLPFPTFPRFCGQTFYEADDKELGLACVKAYNDWMVEEWCGPSGGMNIPLCIMPLWDVELAAAEIQRNADRGVRAFCFSELPHHLKLPTIHSGDWDPVFQVCNDTGVTLCMHIGSSSTNPAASPDAPGGVGGTLAFNNSMASLADWLFSGKLIEFPKLKLAYSEGQIGWIPYALERADTVWDQHDSWQHSKERIPEPPSTYYYGRIFGCFTADHHGLHSLRRGRRGQHLLRDRLPAHRHDVARHPRSTSRRCSPTSTRRSPTRCCAATRSRCWSSTGCDAFGGARTGAQGPPLGHQGAEALRRRPAALARRSGGARAARRVCAWVRSTTWVVTDAEAARTMLVTEGIVVATAARDSRSRSVSESARTSSPRATRRGPRCSRPCAPSFRKKALDDAPRRASTRSSTTS